MLRQEDLQVDVGRCQGGSFIRVLHVPTGISRQQLPLAGKSARSITDRFVREIEEELVSKGLSQYIVPAYRKRRNEI